MKEELLNKYREWLNSEYVDVVDREELKSIEGNEKEIEDRFFTDLSFGTGGMRGVRGVGSNRINKYTVRKASQGLADYINEVADGDFEKKSVVIAYDCRIGSHEYAINSARVLAGNGITTYVFNSMRSTPELSFAVRALGTQAGIVITASHNPQEYNGYKVYWNDGAQIVDPHASGIVNAVNNVNSFDLINILDEEEGREKGLIKDVPENIDEEFIKAVESNAINREIKGKEDFKIVYTPLHGTGGRPVLRVLKDMGFKSVYTVTEQLEGDGMFPTCPYANPEDPSVYKLGKKLADEVGSDIVMANDPDCDRIGIVWREENGEWFHPNGNQIGLLLMNYILENMDKIPENGAIISTIVSTPMLDVIANEKNVRIFRTLTGFKYIGEKIREFEIGAIDGTYLFGFEESVGYLIGTHVRDKDAVVSTMLIAEMAAYYKSKNISLKEVLHSLYEQYGWFSDGSTAVTKKGIQGMEEITSIMEKLRKRNHSKTLIGTNVSIFKDFKSGFETDFRNGETRRIELPSSDVIQFILNDGTYITVRPSGTEPKIKYYYSVVEDSEKKSLEKLLGIMKRFEAAIDGDLD